MKSLAAIRKEVPVRQLFLRSIFVFLFLLPAIAFGQYYSITCDTQDPAEQFVLDRVFSGNTPYLRSYHYDNGTAIDLTPWSMQFYYSYGQYDTNGGVTINGTISSNCATYLGATNVFFQDYDRYYFSIKGTHSSGYVKTFATGKMIQVYDPATATNLITSMGVINMDWWTNNVGAQVESNRVRIAVFETSKVSRVAFNGTNLIFEGRIASNEAFNVAQALTNTAIDVRLSAEEAATTNQASTNANFGVRIASNETFRITTQPATNAALLAQVAYGVTAYGWSNHANFGYLTTTTNIFTTLYAADRSKLGANISGLTQGVYTGSLTTVSYTGSTALVKSKTYVYGYSKIGADGTSTLSIAGFTLGPHTAVGNYSNHFAFEDTGTNLVLKLDGTGLAQCNASNLYVRAVTSGAVNAAGNLNVGGSVVASSVEAKDFTMTYAGEQTLTNGATITPYSNIKVDNAGGLITLGNPQIGTNGISDGAMLVLRGAAGTGGIQLTNGNGVALNCTQSFLVEENDIMDFLFFDGQWSEIKRIDK